MPIRDTRMMARAIEQRWPVPNEMRAGMIRQLMAIVASKEASPREKTSAFKAILAAEAQNQADEHKVIDVSIQLDHSRISQIASELGIDPALIGDGTTEAGSSSEGDEPNEN